MLKSTMRKNILITVLVATGLLLTGCSVSPLQEAEDLGGEFVDLICELGMEERVTQSYLEDLEELAIRYDEATGPADDQGNDWLKFDVLSQALRDRATALEPRLGDPITDSWEKDLNGQCGFIRASYQDTFSALN